MKTFQTNPNNDFVRGADGNLVIIQDIQAVAQESRHFAATLRGEMIHAIDEGVPYFRDVFSKTPNLSQIEAHLRRRIMSLANVEKINSLTAFIEVETLKYTAQIKTNFGDIEINGDL